ADQQNNRPVKYGGHILGNGVSVQQIEQSVNQMLEDRLTGEKSSLAAFEEAESYMKIVEGMFDESSETSLNTLMTDFWNAWHDLSDNPAGPSQREVMLKTGKNLAARFSTASQDLDQLSNETSREIEAALNRVNALAGEIADVNREIAGFEATKTANDLRDTRNSLLDELGDMINVNAFEQPNGTVSVNVANGASIVNGVDTHQLDMVAEEVVWLGSSDQKRVISDDISGGKIKGWLDVRDEVIPKYQSEVDILAEEMIWAINLQHSQGAGLDYYSDTVTGDYKADQSGLLSSYAFGDRIDHDEDFKMWIRDQSTSEVRYQEAGVDMGVSKASVGNWEVETPGGEPLRYRLTVVDGTTVGDRIVTETDGSTLATTIVTGGDAASALDSGIDEQTLTVYGSPEGTRKIEVKDIAGDSGRSAASVAAALSGIQGIEAYASETNVRFSTTDPATGLTTLPDAEDGDRITFSLYVDNALHEQSFVVDSKKGTLEDQMEDALLAAAESINQATGSDDLVADGMTITSSSGKTLGVEAFEVTDNAGVRLEDFSDFNTGDTVSFTVASDGSPASSTAVSVDLSAVDTTDEAAVATAFYDALNVNLDSAPFSVENDPSTNAIVLRTTDGSNLTLENAGSDSGNDAAIQITVLSGTSADAGHVDEVLNFTAAADDTAAFNSDSSANNDTIGFNGAAIAEDSAGAGNKAAVITGTVTAVMDPGIAIHSSIMGGGSLFATGSALQGSSIITLGGEGGFSGFTQGETISFDVDGTHVNYTVPAAPPVLGELDHAQGMEAALTAALVTPFADPEYQVIRTDRSVSVIKNKELDDPIRITDFSETGTGNATLAVRTGTGTGSAQPGNDLLDAASPLRDAATATLYNDEGVIKWERLNQDGFSTGSDGIVRVSDDGNVTIDENGGSVSFDIAKGSLVAGNTLTVNTDSTGRPDPLDFQVRGSGSSVMDTYRFTVVQGGKVGHLPGEDEEPLTIRWTSSSSHGEFQIKGEDPPVTPDMPVAVEVDNMTLEFNDGTLHKDDVFTITTDQSGSPVSETSSGMATGETLADWHWTVDSFAGQFNRKAGGVKASVTRDNRLQFEQDHGHHAISNVEYSGESINTGFSQANTEIRVTNHAGFTFEARDVKFQRLTDGTGTDVWKVLNDPTGGDIQIIPEGGDDDGFGVDLTRDGVADMEILFKKPVTGNGFVEMDFTETSGEDFSFAFSDDGSEPAGVMAAAGINTFFTGENALTMGVNADLNDTGFIAAAAVNSDTGEISQGDNANALALADIQFETKTMKQWSFSRGGGADSSVTGATLDQYYSTMVGSMGITLRGIENARESAGLLVNSITEKRDAVSAVSLDEEMINLMKFQHAFSAASKLISVSDEMLNTIIGIR
ncbi:MAG TPA: flagellar hook-associated protein FlgK, partial [Desulfobacteraceae bacterium]|nr:flagellar hook-associated protein FlgK [Desulfobacteraceae bacterium]